MPENARPDCWKCAYRGSVPGSAHLSCRHPAFENLHADPMMELMAIFGSVGRGPSVNVVADGCVVEGDPRGIASGWFSHPFNFDPVWLRSCTGFKAETGEQKS